MGNNIMNFDNNDVYFMENLEDVLVINDNYSGVILLNKHLEIMKKLALFNGLMIYSSFKYKNEILLYCHENSCFVYINTESCQHKIIPLKEYEDVTFSISYKWDGQNIILSDYGGFFVEVDLHNSMLRKADSQNLSVQSFKKTYTMLRKFVPVKGNISENKILVKTSDSKLVLIQNEKEEKLKFAEQELYHDYEFLGDYFAKIGERNVEISAKDTNISFTASDDYFFLRGKFLAGKDAAYFFLLSASKEDVSKSKIERYTFNLH